MDSRRYSIFASVLCLCAGLLLSSCAGRNTKVDFTLRRDKTVDEVIRNVRTEKVYRDLDTIFIADILWYRPDLKRSFVETVKGEGRINEEQERQMLQEIAEKQEKEIEFIVGLYTSDKRWNDLEKENSMWKATLKGTDGSWVSPLKIEKVKADKMQDAWLFPFLTDWKNAYRVTFPAGGAMAGASEYTLRLSSIVGDGTFCWELSKSN